MDSEDPEKSSILLSVLTFGANNFHAPSTSGLEYNQTLNNIEDTKDNLVEKKSINSVEKNKFHVDRNKIHAVANENQDSELQNLGLDVYNQDDFEEGVLAQVDAELAAQEEIRLNMQLEKEMKAIQEDVSSCQQEVKYCDKLIEELTPQVQLNKEVKRRINAVKMQKENKMRQLKRLQGRQKALIQKTQRSIQALQEEDHTTSNGKSNVQRSLGLPSGRKETEAERMVRMGEMTPFGTVMPSSQGQQPSTSKMNDFEKYLMDQQSKTVTKKTVTKSKKKMKRTSSEMVQFEKDRTDEPGVKKMNKSKSSSEGFGGQNEESSPFKNREGNYFDAIDKKSYRPNERDFSNYKSGKRQIYPKLKHNFSGSSRPDFDPDCEYDSDDYYRDNDYQPSQAELLDPEEDEEEEKDFKVKRVKGEFDLGVLKEKYTGKKKKRASGSSHLRPNKDDGNLDHYQDRIIQWKRKEMEIKRDKILNGENESEESNIEFDGGFKVPAKIWNKLYRYQKTGVKWLWELHMQQCGGIVGDEMGLGKTIQMIAFLVGLQNSPLRDKGSNSKFKGLGPTIIVCPATVMHQWVKEFHTWWPPFRVAVLHNTGSYTQKLSEKDLVHNIVKNCGILITSFSSIVIHQEILLRYDWHYIVLDEGHKIRNPDAQTTLACKQFRTCHRLILSGSPMQNNLKELWSLFDFVFPGKLGTLPDFMTHFSVPIVQGGYSNASQVQVQTAYKCACVLRDTINPYLIRRMKADVKTSLNLPQKNEQVLFCRLTDHQRDVYQEYLDSKECDQILRGQYMVFPGLITLRKICNHSDLSTGGPRAFSMDSNDMTEEELEYGYFRRSGKLIVIESLLKLWKKQGHKVLLFSQGIQMLNILESFVQKQGYNYLRMDGTTGISGRQPLIRKFNETPEIFVFLLTTRVGGLGTNLTGANRVVIFDPDWNPSTDTQARERAWRIGQEKQVTIYRLITTGTIEEKIYHRQIFKQFLTNRVLKDPKQRRFFKSNDLFELFTLGTDDPNVGTETSAIFAGTGSDIKVKMRPKESSKKKKKNRFDMLRESKDGEEEDPDIDTSGTNEGEVDFDKDKLTKMRELAKRLSIQFSSTSKTEIKDYKTISNEDNSSQQQSVSPSTVIKTECDETGNQSADINTTGCAKSTNNKSTSLFDNSNNYDTNSVRSNSVAGDISKSSQKVVEVKHEVNDEEERRRRKKEKKRKRKEEEERKRKAEERKKKKKKRKRDAVLEGEKIAHLDRYKQYEHPNSDDDNPKHGDEYVLQKLFQKSGGLHSAIQHDNIMQSSNPDYVLVEGEAERVAREAAKALKRSRQQCYRAQSGMPTWTGSSGVAKPRFGQKKNTKLVAEVSKEEKLKQEKKVKPVVDELFAPDPIVKLFDGSIAGSVKTGSTPSAVATTNVMSSSQLLETMRKRNFLVSQPPDDDDNEGIDGEDNDLDNPWSQPVSIDTNPVFVELVTDIRNHVAFGCSIDGQASTDELLEHFQTRLPPKDTARFKAMLKQICTFNKRDDIGIWRLKAEFR